MLLGQHSINNKSFCCPATFQLFLDWQDKGFTRSSRARPCFILWLERRFINVTPAAMSTALLLHYGCVSGSVQCFPIIRHLLNSSCLNEMLRIQQWSQGLLPVWDGDVINVLWPWRNWALMNLSSLFTWLLCEVSEEPFGPRVCVLPTPFCFAFGRTIKSIGDSTIQAHWRSFDYHTE